MINVRNLSVFLISVMYAFQVMAADVIYKTGFTSSLQRFNTYQSEIPPCPKTFMSSCPKILLDLTKDDDDDRALGLIKSNAAICRKPLEDKDTRANMDLLKDPYQLQKAFQSNPTLDVGAFSRTTLSSCASLPAKQSAAVTSKFYYYTTRLNTAAKKAAEESYLVSKILGKLVPACPSSDVLNQAAVACKHLETCTTAPNLKQLSVAVQKDEEIYTAFVDKVKSLPKNCKDEPKCKTEKDAYELAIFGLIEKNPWFLNSDFRSAKSKPTEVRLKNYLEESNKGLVAQQKKIHEAALCIHGSRMAGCDLDQIRETLANTPEVHPGLSIFKNQNLTTKLITMQSCLEEWSLERNRVGKIMTDFYWDAGLTIATVGLGAIATSSKAAYLNSESKLAQLMGLGAEVTNFSFDLYNAGGAIKDAVNACAKNSEVNLTKNSSSLKCSMAGSALSPLNREHGSCLLQAGLALFGVGVSIPGSLRIAKLLSEQGAVIPAVAKAEAAVVASATARSTKSDLAAIRKTKTVSATEEAIAPNSKKVRAADATTSATPNAAVTLKSSVPQAAEKIKVIDTHPVLPNLPSEMTLKEVEKMDGTKRMIVEYAEKNTDGDWVKAATEVPIDDISGAINANFSSGRKVFDLIAQSKAGKAYLAFIDVGMLGAVNNKFKSGTAAGDRYLKAVADEIMKSGEGKVTLARLGGDEFGLIIDSKIPAEVKKILETIQANIRKNLDGDAHQVFREEKIVRAEKYREEAAQLTKENPDGVIESQKLKLREGVDELAKIQQPDISIGSTQIGHGETVAQLQQVAEEQAKQMKIKTALNFGRSAEKYGSEVKPNERINPMYTAPIEDAATSSYWVRSVPAADAAPSVSTLRSMTTKPVEEMKHIGSSSLLRSVDELGRTVYTIEKTVPSPTGVVRVVTEVPTNTATGLLDGRHPEIQKLIVEHIQSSADTVVIVPKVASLKYLNYFEEGTAVGDKVLALAADIMKQDLRSTDMLVKLGGADFIWSVSKGAADNIKKIGAKINEDLANSPAFKEIIQNERKSIMAKIEELQKPSFKEIAKAPSVMKEIAKLKDRLSSLDNFKPDLQFQTASHAEVQNLSFPKIVDLFEGKYKTVREAASVPVTTPKK